MHVGDVQQIFKLVKVDIEKCTVQFRKNKYIVFRSLIIITMLVNV